MALMRSSFSAYWIIKGDLIDATDAVSAAAP
jgi:hypothetical protein